MRQVLKDADLMESDRNRTMFPIQLQVRGVTTDSMSFQDLNPYEVEIPIGLHVGAFSATRKFDVHKGVDLYAPKCTPVHAVEDGHVVDIRIFTGPAIGMDWWNETMAVSVEGKTGVIVYGEIIPDPNNIKLNGYVTEGTQIGRVDTVLKKDKGRPMSMLHFALHRHNVLGNGRWLPGHPQPSGLLDPTNLLVKEWQKTKMRITT